MNIQFFDVIYGGKYKILRSTSWNTPLRIIGDDTRSGFARVRMAHSGSKQTYSVTLQMNEEDSVKFKRWFLNDDLSGLNPFYLPKIDRVNGEDTVYRFIPGTDLKWSNTAGDILEVTFDLEEL